MLEVVEKYILENNLKDATVLIAYSGGVDSACLLDVCSKLPINCVALHLNHNWRGEESEQNERTAREFCASLGVEFYSETLDSAVKKTETTAREERYKFFEKCAQMFDANAVFLAHNKNDNVETLLYRIIKGTGVKGLCSIPHVRGLYHRPFLGVAREDIEKYAAKNHLPIAFDSSNDNTKYARNYIRQELLPKILHLNPNAMESIENLIKIAKAQCEIVDDARESVMVGDAISTQKFLSLPKALQMAVLHDFLKDDLKNCSYKKISELWEIITENAKYPSPKKCSLNSELYLTSNKIQIAKIPIL